MDTWFHAPLILRFGGLVLVLPLHGMLRSPKEPTLGRTTTEANTCGLVLRVAGIVAKRCRV